ncbi:MAG: ATP-binding protein [Paludibacteraceae bacterium]|nr:ATP-binding protein [Paludibacteraceae bacterium]
MKLPYISYKSGSLFLSIALLIVIVSVLFTNNLARQLQQEEQRHVETWAEATRQLILADESTDLNFLMTIIEGNTTIPVYMTDADGKVIDSRNVRHPVADPRTLNGPIELRISDDIVQYIYYDESLMLTRLRFFPYIEFGIIFLFVLIAVVTLYTGQRSEQNRVWVGLSKETAHQLGTPISSLNAWQELLSSRYPEDDLIPQMRLDIDRLQVIAERFSKVGSEPELETTNLYQLVTETADYMRTRISSKVEVMTECQAQSVLADVSKPLVSWVLENLIKNAIDAMDGRGRITLQLSEDEDHLLLDISDTGRGIDRSLYRTVFRPGYTSKARGWGLGLSLSQRIIQDYHRGRLFIKQSTPGVGTTFRIVFEKAKNG